MGVSDTRAASGSQLVILEGARASGKTTLALAISRAKGWPVYRAFRRDPDDHSPGQGDHRLAIAGVPVNTPLEDIYVADFIGSTKPTGIIMDRSLPSAMAHLPYFDSRLMERRALAGIWADSLRRIDHVFLFLIKVSPSIARTRAAGRPFDMNTTLESDRIANSLLLIDFPYYVIDGDASSDSVQSEILEVMDGT